MAEGGRLGFAIGGAHLSGVMESRRVSARPLPLLLVGIAVISVGALAIALLGQYAAAIAPCVLCLYARVPYLVAAILAVTGLLVLRSPAWQSRLASACAAVFAGGAALALFHVGVENHWWAGPAGCRGELAGADALSTLLQGSNATTLRPCDEDVWRLFGVSLAGWNGLASSTLAVGTAIAVLKLRRSGYP